MSNVVDRSNQRHNIEPYRFKILHQQGGVVSFEEDTSPAPEPEPEPISPAEAEKVLEEAIEQTPLPPAPEPEPVAQPNPSFIEELLKRTEELSDNLVKLQMKIESQESEFKERLASDTAKALEDGKAEGHAQAAAEFDARLKEIEASYTGSFKKLEGECVKITEFLDKSEPQLSHTAIDIAKQVIEKELSQNSAEVATSIAKSLIAELKDASKIEVKINPQDYETVSKNLAKIPNLSVSEDDAIAKGGVLVLSNIANMDGTIATRFEKIKKILSE